MGTTQECYELSRTNSGSNNPRNDSCMAANLFADIGCNLKDGWAISTTGLYIIYIYIYILYIYIYIYMCVCVCVCVCVCGERERDRQTDRLVA